MCTSLNTQKYWKNETIIIVATHEAVQRNANDFLITGVKLLRSNSFLKPRAATVTCEAVYWLAIEVGLKRKLIKLMGFH